MDSFKNPNSIKKTQGAGITYQRRIALIAGFSLLLMIVSIILAEVVAMAGIVVGGNAAATFENIVNNQSRVRLGIVAYLGVILLDLVAAWAFYIFLKPTKDNLSLLAAWSRLVYAVIFAIALINVYHVFQLIGDAGYLSAFETPEIQAQVMLSLNAFRDTWHVGYIFFGIHLLLLGVVAFRSGFIPKFVGILLALAGISYLIDYLGLILFPDLDLSVSSILGYGELIFMFWLLIWGGKEKPAANELGNETI